MKTKKLKDPNHTESVFFDFETQKGTKLRPFIKKGTKRMNWNNIFLEQRKQAAMMNKSIERKNTVVGLIFIISLNNS